MKYQQYKFLSPVTFVIALAGFFLTFTEINCNGQQLDTITGIELVTGYEQDLDIVKNDTAVENKADVTKYDPNIFALNAFLAAIIGIILMLFKKLRENFILVAIIASIGFICLMAMMIDLKSKIANAQNDSESTINLNLNIDFEMKFGFWLVSLSFLVAAIWNIIQWRILNNTKPITEPNIEDTNSEQ